MATFNSLTGQYSSDHKDTSLAIEEVLLLLEGLIDVILS